MRIVTLLACALVSVAYAQPKSLEQHEAEIAEREARARAYHEAQRQRALQGCDTTFPARLADAKRALVEYGAERDAYEKVRPALEWFEANCRFLTELEVAARKLDDANAFVCDPKAQARPKNLTSTLVLQFSVEPTVSAFQAERFHGTNHRCRDVDPVSLVFGEAPRRQQLLQQLEVACWGDESAKCVEARATIAAERAKAAQ